MNMVISVVLTFLFKRSESPLLHLSNPLESPSPFYDKDRDAVMCYAIPKYGSHNWELPPVKRELRRCHGHDADQHADDSARPMGYRKRDESVRWFARLLLEGAVLPELKSIFNRSALLVPPAHITQMAPNLKVRLQSDGVDKYFLRTVYDEQIANVLRAMAEMKISSLKSLRDAVAKNENFLVAELQDMLIMNARKSFADVWARSTRPR